MNASNNPGVSFSFAVRRVCVSAFQPESNRETNPHFLMGTVVRETKVVALSHALAVLRFGTGSDNYTARVGVRVQSKKIALPPHTGTVHFFGVNKAWFVLSNPTPKPIRMVIDKELPLENVEVFRQLSAKPHWLCTPTTPPHTHITHKIIHHHHSKQITSNIPQAFFFPIPQTASRSARHVSRPPFFSLVLTISLARLGPIPLIEIKS